MWCVVVCGVEKTSPVNEKEGQGPLGGYRAQKKNLKRNREILTLGQVVSITMKGICCCDV